MYGPMLDAKTKGPLFNKAAWKRANNVLKEIITGNASDPCGMTFYSCNSPQAHCCNLWWVLFLEGQWLGEHHQLKMERKLNAREARTRLKD